MRKRKLWKVYDCLEKQEKIKFRAWLELELDGRQARVLSLLEGLEAYDQGLISEEDPSETKASETIPSYQAERQLWAHLYPGEVFDYDQFRRLTEQLIRWLEEYLSIIAFRRDQNAKDLYLVKEVGRRDPHILFPTTYKKVRNRLERSPIRDATYYHMVYRLENEYQLYLVHHVSPKKNRQPQRQQAFNQWWLLEKLEMAIEARMLIELKLLPNDPDEMKEYFCNFILNDDNINSFSRNAVFTLYLKLFILKLGREVKTQVIVDWLKMHKQSFSNDKFINYFFVVFNHLSIQASHTQEVHHNKALLEFYQWALSEKLLFTNNKLPRKHYKNLITLCLKMANFTQSNIKNNYLDMAYRYIHNLKDLLEAQVRDDEYHFNLANYFFTIGEYSKVESSQRGVVFSNIHYSLQGRLIALRARYEMKERKHLSSAIRSFQAFLKNQPDGAVINSSYYITHLRLFKRLVLAQTKEDYLKLRKAVGQIPQMYEKKWLLSKIEDALKEPMPINFH